MSPQNRESMTKYIHMTLSFNKKKMAGAATFMLHVLENHGGIIIWSGPGVWIVLRRVAGVHCVRYIEQKDFMAWLASGAV